MEYATTEIDLQRTGDRLKLVTEINKLVDYNKIIYCGQCQKYVLKGEHNETHKPR